MKKINKKFVSLYEEDVAVDEILKETDTELSKRAVKARIYRNTSYRQGNEIKWGRKDCNYCGEEFKPTSHKEQKFCSEECFGKAKDSKKEVKCNGCGDSIERKENEVKKKNNLYCCRSCYYKDKKSKYIGENNPNWRGGSSFEEYPEEFNSQLKQEVRERDNHTCQMCGMPEPIVEDVFNRVLEVHHLDENKDNCEIDNLISVCRSCHGRLQNKELAENFKKYVDSPMSRKKGYRRENQCVKTLKEADYKAERSLDPAYSAGDWFGLFDVMGVRADKKPVFIQVKANTTQGALKQIYEADFINLKCMDVEVWVALDQEGWRIKRLTKDDGWIDVVDEREHDCNYGEKVVELYSNEGC